MKKALALAAAIRMQWRQPDLLVDSFVNPQRPWPGYQKRLSFHSPPIFFSLFSFLNLMLLSIFH